MIGFSALEIYESCEQMKDYILFRIFKDQEKIFENLKIKKNEGSLLANNPLTPNRNLFSLWLPIFEVIKTSNFGKCNFL
jgi:hypothetical protein